MIKMRCQSISRQIPKLAEIWGLGLCTLGNRERNRKWVFKQLYTDKFPQKLNYFPLLTNKIYKCTNYIKSGNSEYGRGPLAPPQNTWKLYIIRFSRLHNPHIKHAYNVIMISR